MSRPGQEEDKEVQKSQKPSPVTGKVILNSEKLNFKRILIISRMNKSPITALFVRVIYVRNCLLSI